MNASEPQDKYLGGSPYPICGVGKPVPAVTDYLDGCWSYPTRLSWSRASRCGRGIQIMHQSSENDVGSSALDMIWPFPPPESDEQHYNTTIGCLGITSPRMHSNRADMPHGMCMQCEYATVTLLHRFAKLCRVI